jgi:hypothetical protein
MNGFEFSRGIAPSKQMALPRVLCREICIFHPCCSRTGTFGANRFLQNWVICPRIARTFEDNGEGELSTSLQAARACPEF